MDYFVNEDGYFGEFGGAFVPEMLMPNILELQSRYKEIINSPEFQAEYQDLLKNYAGRPTPLYHAKNLSHKYNTIIYLKREDLLHTGAHKINNTLGQALLAKRLGKKRIIAETGAGQHGVATAAACALLGLKCIVYMGEIDIQRQAPNVKRMHMLGAKIVPATSGSKTLKDATNEAMRDWMANPEDSHYIIGSVVGPHPYPDMVAIFNSVTSKEIEYQSKEIFKRDPDAVLACVGGGSNAIGAFYHYINKPHVRLYGAEAAGDGVETNKTAASMAKGSTGVLHGSMTLFLQTKDGQVEEAHSISAGLDYPGVGPQHAHLHTSGRATYLPVTDKEALEAAFELSTVEGIIPALESAHAVAMLKKINFKPEEIVVINISGRGDKDLATYEKFAG